MEKIGTGRVWLTGSRKTIERVVYKDGDKLFVKWYGQMIEVIRGINAYVTIEEY